MKKMLLLGSVLMLASGYSEAARLYMKKTYSLFNSTGSFELTCRFYSNKVEITERVNGTSSSLRVVPTTYSGATLSSLVSRASTNTYRSEPFNICDGGSASVRAYRASGSSFTLMKFEDCGATKNFRSGPSSLRLRQIAEQYCESFMPTVK